MFQTQGSAFNTQELRIRDFLVKRLKRRWAWHILFSLARFRTQLQAGKKAGLMPFNS